MWYHEKEGGVLLQLKVIPGAKSNEIAKWHPESSLGAGPDFLKIKLAAAPNKGQANQALQKMLAKKLGLAASDVRIVRGRTNSLKIVFVPVTADQIRAIFG